MLAIGKVMVRTHEKVSLTTSESDTGYRGWQKPMSASATQIFINQVNLTAPANDYKALWDFPQSLFSVFGTILGQYVH